MVDKILAALRWLPSELYIFVISMLPLIELRGAVPIGALLLDMPFYVNFAVSVLGNMFPIPFILLFIPKIFRFLSKFKVFRPMVEWLHKKANKNKKKIIKEDVGAADSISEAGDVSIADGAPIKAEEPEPNDAEKAAPCAKARMSVGIFVALMLFVAVPLPGTGAWTGALVASLFGLSKRYSFLSIFLGVVICGVIMCLASYGVLGFLSFLL